MNMKHIKEYKMEFINEAKAKLGPMPSFLKTAGAKPSNTQFSGPRRMNNPDDHWSLEVKSPFKKDSNIIIAFYPDKSFYFHTAIGPGAKYEGKWQEGISSDIFKFGEAKIKGVKMQFTTFGGMQTVD